MDLSCGTPASFMPATAIAAKMAQWMTITPAFPEQIRVSNFNEICESIFEFLAHNPHAVAEAETSMTEMNISQTFVWGSN